MLDLKAIMDDYFSSMPISTEERSPLSIEFVTAPSSLANSPSESGNVSEAENEGVERFHDIACDEHRETAAVEQDVAKIEQNINQLLSFGDVLQKDVEGPKQDTQLHHPPRSQPASPYKDSQRKHKTTPTRPQKLTFNHPSPVRSTEYKLPRPSTPFHPNLHKRSFSSPPITTSTDLETSSPILHPFMSFHDSQPPPSDRDSLKAALKVVQAQLGLLEKGIKTNIEQQIAAMKVEPGMMMDEASVPGFKVKGRDKWTAKALLDTVKVLCVLERGLESVVSVLELGKEDGEGEKEGEGKGLMDACLERSRTVRREMRDVLKGVEGVLGFEGVGVGKKVLGRI